MPDIDPCLLSRISTVSGSAKAARKTSPKSRRNFSSWRSTVPGCSVTTPIASRGSRKQDAREKVNCLLVSYLPSLLQPPRLTRVFIVGLRSTSPLITLVRSSSTRKLCANLATHCARALMRLSGVARNNSVSSLTYNACASRQARTSTPVRNCPCHDWPYVAPDSFTTGLRRPRIRSTTRFSGARTTSPKFIRVCNNFKPSLIRTQAVHLAQPGV